MFIIYCIVKYPLFPETENARFARKTKKLEIKLDRVISLHDNGSSNKPEGLKKYQTNLTKIYIYIYIYIHINL